jgi:two-component system, NtrC family, sensor kinase
MSSTSHPSTSIPSHQTGLTRLRNMVLGGVLLVLMLLGAATAAILWSIYLHNREQTEDRLARVTRLLEEHTLRNVQSVDLVLQIMGDTRPFRLRDHDPEYQDWLRRRLNELPHIRALFIIGADGYITQDTDHPSTPRVSLADRDYFRFHQHSRDVTLHIAEPLWSRSVDRWFVAVTRRVSDGEGAFLGLVAAALEPIFFEEFYSELVLDSGDAIALWHADGTLIARIPEDYGLVGRPVPGSQLVQRASEQPRGVFTRTSPYQPGETRVVAYSRLPDLPFVVSTSTSLEPTMALWWRSVIAASVTFLLLAGLAIATPLILFRRLQEREAMQRRAMLLQKSEALGRMTSGIAHDFNNLLAAVASGLGLVDKSASDPEKVRSFTAATRTTIERGSRLVSQLLSFARNQELEVESADANELLRDLEPILRHAAGPSVKISLELESGLRSCVVDRPQFDAAILNLVVNARDAMPEGGVITITTTLWHQKPQKSAPLSPGDYVLVRVIDTGPGIPPQIAAQAFEPFFTTEGDKGTGLGLAQVFSFMRQIGGDARIDQNHSSGGAIELSFPCAPEE